MSQRIQPSPTNSHLSLLLEQGNFVVRFLPTKCYFVVPFGDGHNIYQLTTQQAALLFLGYLSEVWMLLIANGHQIDTIYGMPLYKLIPLELIHSTLRFGFSDFNEHVTRIIYILKTLQYSPESYLLTTYKNH